MVRTSTTSRTSAFFSKPTKTSSGRTECPIVKNGFAIYDWRRTRRSTDPFAQGGVIALSVLNLVLWVVHTHGRNCAYHAFYTAGGTINWADRSASEMPQSAALM